MKTRKENENFVGKYQVRNFDDQIVYQTNSKCKAIKEARIIKTAIVYDTGFSNTYMDVILDIIDGKNKYE
jgi:hypothetical protein